MNNLKQTKTASNTTTGDCKKTDDTGKLYISPLIDLKSLLAHSSQSHFIVH